MSVGIPAPLSRSRTVRSLSSRCVETFRDGAADGDDVQPFLDCLLGGDCPPPVTGDRPDGTRFGLHGAILDVLSDGLILQYNRARYYDARHGRWLQRDPSGYVDGNNLYESFGSNPYSFTDPEGRSTGLVSDWKSGDEVFYERTLPFLGVQDRFSVGKYFYRDGEKLILYERPGDLGAVVYALPFEQVEGWARKIAEESDYDAFVAREGVRFNRRTGERIEPTVQDAIAGWMDRIEEDRLERFDAMVRGAEYFFTAPVITAVTGEDPISMQSVPGRFRVVAAGFTALDFLPFAPHISSFARTRVAPAAASAFSRLESIHQRAMRYLVDATPGSYVTGTGVSPGSTPALRAGQAGRFADLDRLAVVGDNLTPHHMPQAALGFTTRAEGGAIVLEQAEHALTRTFLGGGARLAQSEAGLPFRTVLGRDIRNLRNLVASKYNQGVRELLQYYQEHFPGLMKRP